MGLSWAKSILFANPINRLQIVSFVTLYLSELLNISID